MAAKEELAELALAYPLERSTVEAFTRDGYVRLKDVLSAPVLEHYGAAIDAYVARENKLGETPWEDRSTYQRAFIQIMNLWRSDETARELVFAPRLADLASRLMGVSGVRLYHDQALYKEPSPPGSPGGHTPWHVDQYYWPLDTDNTVTAWIPLQAVPAEMGPLAFARGSQHFVSGRDLAISDQSEEELSSALEAAGFEIDAGGFDLGEVSFHRGYTFHRAEQNHSDRVRRVMTIIYMDESARLKAPENDNQKLDWETWLPGVEIGEVAASPLNPKIALPKG